ncbi:MAG: tryptophan synthase subunit alpha [Bacteroidota bacterium]
MKKLKEILNSKPNGLLNIYCTAGYPNLNDLPTIVNSVYEAGADMIEIGMPYSDPIADGPTIQESNGVALANGISIEKIFDQLELCRPEIPKILMGYINPVMQFGLEKFCARCEETGIDGLILPDLPIEIYESRYKSLFDKHGLSNIFLITPQTSLERIQKIDNLSSTFIYAVSSASTTGKGTGLAAANDYLEGLKSLPIDHPILVGFNIAKPEDLTLVHKHANGGIIGSAFIKFLKDKPDVGRASKDFVDYITNNASVS